MSLIAYDAALAVVCWYCIALLALHRVLAGLGFLL